MSISIQSDSKIKIDKSWQNWSKNWVCLVKVLRLQICWSFCARYENLGQFALNQKRLMDLIMLFLMMSEKRKTTMLCKKPTYASHFLGRVTWTDLTVLSNYQTKLGCTYNHNFNHKEMLILLSTYSVRMGFISSIADHCRPWFEGVLQSPEENYMYWVMSYFLLRLTVSLSVPQYILTRTSLINIRLSLILNMK